MRIWSGCEEVNACTSKVEQRPGSQSELAGSMLSGFVVLHRSSSNEPGVRRVRRRRRRPARGAQFPLGSASFSPLRTRRWRPVESKTPGANVSFLSLFPLLFLLLSLSLSLSLSLFLRLFLFQPSSTTSLLSFSSTTTLPICERRHCGDRPATLARYFRTDAWIEASRTSGQASLVSTREI